MAQSPRKSRGEAAQSSASKGSEGVSLGELPTLMGFMLRQAQLAMFRAFVSTFDELDLRPSQFGILMVIQANPGLSQSDISDALGIKRANLVAMLDTLEGRGLIQRRTMANDRRSRSLHLTDNGQAFIAKMLKLHSEMECRIETALGHNGKQELLAHLNTLIQVLGAKPGDGAPEDGE